MQTVLLVIHLLIAMALVGIILLQRSEGGALGIGGGGGVMTGRAAGNLLTRTTAILATAFFATSIGLALLANVHNKPTEFMQAKPPPISAPAPVAPAAPVSR
jgi:preprotein translocase subunit SecG